MKKIEQKINNMLNKQPKIKKIIKRLYQRVMYLLSKKIKYQGDIKRVTPNDEYEYFFGYYDKSPWDASNRYMLCHRVLSTIKSVSPKEPADIIIIDTKNDNSIQILGQTYSWNNQQGSMLQWLGPDYQDKIIYNDFREGRHCSVILSIKSMNKKIIDKPIYSVSSKGDFALTLDFSRLHRLRKGYGYSNLEDETKYTKIPDKPCIWYVNLHTNTSKAVFNYTDLYNFETRSNMEKAEHRVNHIMLNPSGTRFMVLHRWVSKKQTFTRLLTADVDGNNIFNLSDDDMTSHCYWKNDDYILAYARKHGLGNGYFLMKDKTHDFFRLFNDLVTDGHPSYSHGGDFVVTDSYPDRTRLSSLYVLKDNKISTIAKVFSPFKYDNDFRCDLHPRWNRTDDEISFDASFEGKRGLYVINIKSIKEED
jgi:hypothetical protein